MLTMPTAPQLGTEARTPPAAPERTGGAPSGPAQNSVHLRVDTAHLTLDLGHTAGPRATLLPWRLLGTVPLWGVHAPLPRGRRGAGAGPGAGPPGPGPRTARVCFRSSAHSSGVPAVLQLPWPTPAHPEASHKPAGMGQRPRGAWPAPRWGPVGTTPWWTWPRFPPGQGPSASRRGQETDPRGPPRQGPGAGGGSGHAGTASLPLRSRSGRCQNPSSGLYQGHCC